VAAIRRNELAAFLRHRREHLTPEQVGLPPPGACFQVVPLPG
jgi:hypothetical protein